jgi:drug/metabolite transporter (DMT)-like permease
LGWTAFFALCGLVAALVTGDWDFMKAITVFGLIAGLLFGVGDIIIQAVRSRQEPTEEDRNPAADATSLGGHILGALVPALKPFILLGMAVGWIATKDFRRQAPGRGRRALVGAVVMGILGIGILTAAFVVVGPPPPGGMTILEGLILVLVLSTIGAVLGLLSDSW